MSIDRDPAIHRLRERLEYRNNWVRIYFDDVEKPSGPGRYVRIEEGSVGAGPGVVVIPQRVDGQLLLLLNYRYPIGEWVWELPRGYGEVGQTGLQSAERELAEETGLRAARFVELGFVYPNTGLLATRVCVVLAEDVSGEIRLEADDAIVDSRWATQQDLATEIAAGQLRDAISLSALLLLRSMSRDEITARRPV
jgi:ADP-ribose pyrophosphatase